MSEIRNCLKWLGIHFLLLCFNIILYAEMIPESFLSANISSIYLLILASCLIHRFYLRVAEQSRVKKLMLRLSVMLFVLILLRCIKYSVFGSESVWGRYCWYFYYLPILLIPMYLFYVSLCLFSAEERAFGQKWGWVTAITAALIMLVLSNDFHEQVFCFHPGFAEWDSDYSYSWGYIALIVWEYALYVAAITVLLKKCSVVQNRKRSLVLLVPFVFSMALRLLHLTGAMPKIAGNTIMGFPETIFVMVAGVLECCMQLGLIPTNESYGKLMRLTSIPVQITDRSGNCIFQSGAAKKLTKEQFTLPDSTRIGEHTILRRMELPGGFGFWEKDVTELDRLNEELEETKERLSEESELLRLENELKEKQKKIEQRTLVYDAIAKSTREQSQAISRLANAAMQTENETERERYCRRITLLGAYIKRYANLKLLSSEQGKISVGELGLSVAELLRYLNLYGIPGEMLNTAEGNVSGEQALAAFEVFNGLIEENLAELCGVLAHLSIREGRFGFKLTLENAREDFSGDAGEKLAALGIRTALERENEVSYYSFTFPKGGDAV